MKAFTTSRKINAKPDRIFEAFRNGDQLAKWWGPAGFTNTFNKFEFQPGGKWSFVMHGPDGKNYPNESEFIEIVPNEKVVIRHHSQPNFTLTVLMSKTGDSTLVEWIQDFNSEEVANSVAHIVIPANEQNLNRLTMVVADI